MSELKQCKDTLEVATVEAHYFYGAPQHVQLLEAAALNGWAGFSFNGRLSWCFWTKWHQHLCWSPAKTSHTLRVHREYNEPASCILFQQAAAIQLRNPTLSLALFRYDVWNNGKRNVTQQRLPQNLPELGQAMIDCRSRIPQDNLGMPSESSLRLPRGDFIFYLWLNKTFRPDTARTILLKLQRHKRVGSFCSCRVC